MGGEICKDEMFEDVFSKFCVAFSVTAGDCSGVTGGGGGGKEGWIKWTMKLERDTSNGPDKVGD
jgi:hypothetical protein